jgi:hypothetical protein
MTAAAVRARIADLLIATPSHGGGVCEREGDGAGDQVGTFTLRPTQREARDRILRAFEEFGGAVLLDPPGSGKTVVALAVAATHQGTSPTLVLGPAVVRAQWIASAARAKVPILFRSLESLSRTEQMTIGSASHDLAIIDEAHHLRTPGTRRFDVAARLCARARVLALSATPVVNRHADLLSLLRLFLGARADRVTASERGRCLVRCADEAVIRPSVRRLPALRIAPAPDWLATALQTLPDPWPMTGTQAPVPLITMSLAMAWQSSLAALDAALRRREQRGGALLDLLAEGVIPSEGAVRAWTMDEAATQLALPLLVGGARAQVDTSRMSPATTSPPINIARATTQVRTHLDAVRALRRRLAPAIAVDTHSRIDTLRRLLSRFPASRIAVLSQRTETIRALYHGLRGSPGVVAIVGPRVLAAAGRWSREGVLRGLGPHAPPLRADDPTIIRLLLATDVLAEGIELQGVQVLVHADLPWTPARLEQRVGRLTRVGSATAEVQVTRFAAPVAVRPLLTLADRLHAKAVARSRSVRSGVAEDAVRRRIARWALRDADGDAQRDLPASATSVHASVVVVGAVHAARHGFLAVVRVDGRTRLLGGRPSREAGRSRWRVTEDPGQLLTLCRWAEGSSRSVSTAEETRAGRMIRMWEIRRRIRALSAPDEGTGAVQRRMQRRLHRILKRAPALRRAEIAARTQVLLDRVRGRVPVGQERSLTEALALDDTQYVAEVEAVLAPPDRSAPSTPRQTLSEGSPSTKGVVIEALLLLGPGET